VPYENDPNFATPPDDTIVWRYMDFVKFVDVLLGKRLWFRRMDLHDDKREGLLTDYEIAEIKDAPLPEHGDERIHDAVKRALPKSFELVRRRNFICCWTVAEESMAMWDLYAGSAGGVAVRSTIRGLKDSIAAAPDAVNILPVRYVDWLNPDKLATLTGMYARKHLAFRHEGEIRMIVCRPESCELPPDQEQQFTDLADYFANESVKASPEIRKTWHHVLKIARDQAREERGQPGLHLPTDPRRLVDEVIVAPHSKNWLEAIDHLIERCDLSGVTVRPSQLSYV
jgi:hypothetical protein